MTGSLPPGLTTPASASAIADPPCSPGSQAMSTAPAGPVDGLRADRPARDEHEHDRRPRRRDREDEFLLHAGQVERRDVAALAGGAVVGQTGPVAHHHDGHVAAAAAASTAVVETGPVVVDDAAALDVQELDAWKLRGEGVERPW